MAKRTSSFNPRPRTGSDFYHTKRGEVNVVSIHAPARGATTDIPHPTRKKPVSIHAPARGATLVYSQGEMPS